MEKIDEQNFILYAAAAYDNPQAYETAEFNDDLKRFKYIKRLFNKYLETGEIKERLILNHLIVLYNVFGVEPATKMLFFRLRTYYEILKPFLVFLGFMPERVEGIGFHSQTVFSSDIKMDEGIVEALRKIQEPEQ